MKKIIYFLCIIVLLFLISIIPTSAKEIKTCIRTSENLRVPEGVKTNDLDEILKTPCVDDIDKVYDFADLLTDNEETLLYNEVKSFISKNEYDLVLVTILDNPKNNARDYADDFYDYNFFGKNKTRDGILILIDMDTRELYISTSGYAIKMYDDYRIERILDSGYDYIIKDEHYNVFSNMIKSLDDYHLLDYPESNKDLVIDELGNPHYIKYIPYGLVLVISLIMTVVISLILYFKSRLKIKVPTAISYLKNKEINKRNDQFINSVVTHTKRIDNYSSGSRSHGGGSSFHTSSSGRSHGGGGRKF